MKAAVVREAGTSPVYEDFREPQAAPGRKIVRVTAAALTPLAKLRASGKHYSSSAVYPFVAGVDGTGVTDDGRRVYFMLPEPPFGAMAERCAVDERQCIDLPDALADDVAAAIANPGMSSWAALQDRARLCAGETVLVNGATGAAGRLAVRIAKHLGAQRVVATGRRAEVLAGLKALGADATIQLTDDAAALRDAFAAEFRRGIDVVLDYLWGPTAEALIASAAAAPAGRAIRFVQIGSVASETVTLPAAALRSTSLELIGSGIGSVSPAGLLAAISALLRAAATAEFPVGVRRVPLRDVASAWAQPDGDVRIVLVP